MEFEDITQIILDNVDNLTHSQVRTLSRILNKNVIIFQRDFPEIDSKMNDLVSRKFNLTDEVYDKFLNFLEEENFDNKVSEVLDDCIKKFTTKNLEYLRGIMISDLQNKIID